MLCEGVPPRHRCEMKSVASPLCQFHGVFCLYQCRQCLAYHVCDGGTECVLLHTPESVICELTGNCMLGNIQEGLFLGPVPYRTLDNQVDRDAYHGMLACLKRDIVRYLQTWPDTTVIVQEIALGDGVTDTISAIIDETFGECLPVLGEAQGGYALVCSMYLHVIVSIYSTKTVYNSMLFKCTKNKKYDCIAKRVRTKWMRMLSTKDT